MKRYHCEECGTDFNEERMLMGNRCPACCSPTRPVLISPPASGQPAAKDTLKVVREVYSLLDGQNGDIEDSDYDEDTSRELAAAAEIERLIQSRLTQSREREGTLREQIKTLQRWLVSELLPGAEKATNLGIAAVIEGRYRGWVFVQDSNGNWVTAAQLTPETLNMLENWRPRAALAGTEKRKDSNAH